MALECAGKRVRYGWCLTMCKRRYYGLRKKHNSQDVTESQPPRINLH